MTGRTSVAPSCGTHFARARRTRPVLSHLKKEHSGGRLRRSECDFEAERLELRDGTLTGPLPAALIELRRRTIVIRVLAHEQMVGGDQDSVPDRHGRFPLAPPDDQAPVLRRQIALLLPRRGARGFF